MAPAQQSIDAARLLETCFLFKALDETGRSELVARAHRRSYMAGETIVRLGDPGRSMMAVLVGTVRVSLPTPGGKEIILADLPAGEVIGEVALLDGKERSADMTALTNCELLLFERTDVLAFLQRHPEACLKLLELLCGRLRRADERMADIAFFDISVRLAKALLTRAGEPGRAGKKSKISLSQSELAKMIGATRENVNRHLREWQRRGVVELSDGWIVVVKRDLLGEIAASS